MKWSSCEESLSAVMWCMECENSLCHDCHEMHKKWRAFKSHHTVPVKEFLLDPKQV